MIHILLNILKSKGKQTSNEKYFPWKNLLQNVLGMLAPNPFIKTQNWVYLLINSLKCYTVCFYCMSKWSFTKIYNIKVLTTCFGLIWDFLKNKNGQELVSLIFCYFWRRKMFLLLYSIICYIKLGHKFWN